MANPKLTITTPRGTVFVTKFRNGKTKATLKWNPGFGKKMTGYFTKAQMFVDSEVLRFCSARVPFQTGMLQKSGVLGTVVGSGVVRYIAPYSRKQYYGTSRTRPYDKNRGAYWFERGKAVERYRILQGAQRIARGGR
ncbi:MAG: hypothetical protein GX222_08925 [Ruminococcaceae bacterium]|nr:hypothetical protein [Oscillospiraceae bacterium]